MNAERIERSLRMGPPDEPLYRPREMALREVSYVRTRIGLTPRARESSRVTAIGILILIALTIAGIVVIGRLREDEQQPTPTIAPPVIDVPVDGGDQGRTRQMPGPAPSGNPVEAWHIPIANPSPSLVVADGLAIVGDLDGVVRAIDLDTRLERWRRLLGGQVLGGIVVVDDTIYVASGEGVMNALDLSTGEPRWPVPPAASPNATPVVLDGVVYFGRPGEFVALDLESASQLWSIPIAGSGSTTATDGLLVFVGGQGSGELTAVDINAREIAWEVPFRTGHSQVDMPAVRGGVVYVSGQSPEEGRGRLFALSTDGDELWRYPRDADGPMMSTPAVGDDMIFIGSPFPSAADSVTALDPANGNVIWTRDIEGANAQPSVVGDLVFATRYEGTEVLRASDGSDWYSIPTTGNADGALVTGGLVVTVLKASPGDEGSGLWVYAAPDDPRLVAPAPSQSPRSSPASTAPSSPSPSPSPSSPIATVTGEYRFDNGPGMFGGLAVAPDGSLYALDHANARVVRFAPDGTPDGAFGQPGAGDGQFDFSEVTPGDTSGTIAVAADGWIAVGDGGNHRIQLFGPDHAFVRSITGTADDPLINPCCVAFDAQGRIYVSDDGRDDILVFDREGDIVQRMGERGTGPGQLLRAGSPFVAADGTIFVPNYSNFRVEVFAQDGTYLRRYGSDPARQVYVDEVNSVVVDGDGRVLVGDGRNRLIVFDPDGTVLGVFGPDIPGVGPHELGPLAVSPDGRLFAVIFTADDVVRSRILELELVPPPSTDAPQ